MRTLVTFIVRLWVDPQVEEPTWEGQVECVASGERVHVRRQEELVRFIESHTKPEWEKPTNLHRRGMEP